MLEVNNQLSKYDVIARLLHLMDSISEDHQFLIFKKLFKDSVSSQIIKRIIDMTDHQRLILMKHLEEMVEESGNGDKRKTPRKDCLINVNMRLQGPRYNSYILDINQHGAYIETNEAFTIGQQMKLTFASPNSRQPFNVTGEVIRRDPQGVGIKFQNLSTLEMETIRSFVEDRQAVYEINS